MLDGMREGMACTGGAAPSSDATRTAGFKLGFAGSFAACFASARLRSAALVCKRLNSRVTILSGFSRSRLVGAPALDRMRNGMASTRGARAFERCEPDRHLSNSASAL